MAKRFTISLLLWLVLISVHAQREADNWYFGENAGIHFKPAGVVSATDGQIWYNEGISSISDCRGNLLFYTDGETVWNREHVMMANGAGLLGHYSATQGSLIVQHPGDCDLYYIFTLDGKEHAFANGMMYALVDMRLQQGMGEVISKNHPLYAPSSEKLTAVRHRDGQSVWVITHEMQHSNVFHSYLVTTSGLDTTPVLSAAGAPFGQLDALGQMKASPDGRRIAVARLYPELVEVFDFDNSTGVISNPLAIPEETFEKSSLYGLEFSPDGNKLYVTNHSIDYLNEAGSLYQFDLLAGSAQDIIHSGVVVGENVPQTDLRGLQLGPDGRLYVSRSLGKYVGVVNHPNKAGAACAYVDEGIYLNGQTAGWTLPNFMVSYFDAAAAKPVESAFSFTHTCIREPTLFSVQGAPDHTRYQWDFGDGHTAAISHPAHTFQDTGTYTVSLVVTRHCCSDTSSQRIRMEHCYSEQVYVPTAFSPNQDGINDEFKVYGNGIRALDLKIYNRWGGQVFETKNADAGWDGTFRGKILNAGVFVYALSITFENGHRQDLTGDVSLIR